MTATARRPGHVVRCLLALSACVSQIMAADAASADGTRFYEQQVKPILQESCLKCHGGEAKIKGGLRLTGRASILAGGDSGPAVDLAKPAASLLIRMIDYADDEHQMPPKNKQLPPAQRAVLRAWVEMGLPMGRDQGPSSEELAAAARATAAAGRAYWAYLRPVMPPLPPVADRAWVRQPVDAFILARLEAKGLAPAAEAERAVLIRRATYDLIGLPPTPQEVAAFVRDPAQDAYERLVDRLLASPQYGEKWGRHWLDLVHYAETNGYERDGDKENAWRYRDYVIKAFNEDRPYDRFVREQLAGDLLDHPDADAITATGYYRMGLWDDEPADPMQAHYDYFDSIVSTTSQAFLGMGLGCARCHDHKKDPLSQEDYYRMLAFFQGIKPQHKHFPENIQTVIAVDAKQAAENADRLAQLRERVAQAERDFIAKARLPAPAPGAKGDDRTLQRAIAERGEEVLGKKALAALTADRRAIEQLSEDPPGVERALSAVEGDWRETFVLARGNPTSKGKSVTPGFPAVLGFPDPPNDGRRRLALADWIVAPANPLAARVMVNRIWQFHFGRAIVGTANDFGGFGTLPDNQPLLDWLATHFVADGWRIKNLHRLLMTSSAYRTRAEATPALASADPANELRGRFTMRRLSGEEIRDSILAVGGVLNPAMGGPSIFPVMPKEVLAGSSRPDHVWGRSTPQEALRRSVYIKVKRSLQYPLLATHDQADTDSSCPQRFATTVPTQALTMLNSELMGEQSRLFAKRLRLEAPGDAERQVRLAFSLATQREPRPTEIAQGLAFMRELQAKDGLSGERALDLFCLMVLNLNEFVYLE